LNVNLLSGNGTRFKVSFQKCKKYLLRFINTSVDNHFKLHIDGHTLQVIANDFVPITPYTTGWLNIGIGQRYDVVVTANATVGNYYMRAAVQTSCGANLNNGINGTAHGIVHYAGAGSGLPTSTPTSFMDACVDEPVASLKPVVMRTVPSSSFTSQASSLPVGGPSRVAVGGETLFRWYLNGVSQDIDWENPTLLQVANGNTSFATSENVLQLPTANTWVYFVIQNGFFVPHPSQFPYSPHTF
jgi:FtsP/CotA-like multicopper oxidase with cupredoxin domain